MGIPMSYFTEPDIGDELTSICFIETDKTKKLTSHLPLSLRNKSSCSSAGRAATSKLAGHGFDSHWEGKQ